MAKTAEEKKAKRKAWMKKRGEWLRNELRESIDNHDRERFLKAYGYVLTCNYIPLREGKQYYREYLDKWAKIDIENSPYSEDLKKVLDKHSIQ